MNVIFVPMISRLTGAKISKLVWTAAVIALIGCGLLCEDGQPPNIGDLWTLGTAITWAAYIVRIEHGAQRFSALSLAIAQIVPIMLLSLAWTTTWHTATLHNPVVGDFVSGVARDGRNDLSAGAGAEGRWRRRRRR